jgi:putative oxidoreductase
MARLSRFLLVTAHSRTVDLGLFILRVGISLLMIPHGWSKLQKLNEGAGDFYNFLGLGSEVSLLLIVIAVFFCSILLILGIGTRFILIPLIIGMLVVVLMIHGDDPLGDKEHGLLFLVPYVTLFITGPGKHSLDYLIFGRKLLDEEARAKLYFYGLKLIE